MIRPRSSLLFSAFLLPVAAEATFSINFNFNGGLTTSQQAVFNEAKATWESYITGYQPGITQTGITITAGGSNIDGVGGVLGSAGPTSAAFQGGYWLARDGSMNFDSAGLTDMESNGILDEVITHEIGHVLGIGTLWNENWIQLYINGSGQYTGAFALDAYRDEFDPLATYVPVELGGGAGTADAHWNEKDGGLGSTGITDKYSRDLAQELMTGWIGDDSDNHYISNTTLGSLKDLGFEVFMPIPEPGLATLTGLALVWAGFRRRRPLRG
ncbi:MAG: peptidase [Verrucomicrobia bacterium]|nr:peptidase [Verrucomicrobiota bacterium]